MKLKNKVAFITGAASGIGAAMAYAFAEQGAHIVIADLDIEKAKLIVHDLQNSTGFEHLAIKVDVTNEEQVNAGVAQAISHFAQLDILINNAGIQIISPIEQLTLEQWRKMLAIHLDGAFLTTKAALQHMYRVGSGKIIYIGSVHSKLASQLKAPYVTAKHGLLGLNRVVAKEAAQYNVATHVICPGFVKTPLVEKQIPEQAKALRISEEEVIKKIMLKDTVDGEFTTLKDLNECAVFLASFEGLAFTGQSFLVTHGWQME